MTTKTITAVKTTTANTATALKKGKPVITSADIQKSAKKLNKSHEELQSKITPVSSGKLKDYKPSPVLNGLMKQAFSELKKIEGSYLKIALAIYRIHDDKLYLELGCNDIYSFTKSNFGLSRGTCHNFLTIVSTFGKRDAKGVLLNELVDEVKGFKSTQLIIMSGMTPEQLAKCKPEMTCSQLRHIINGAPTISKAVPESSCFLKGSNSGEEADSSNDSNSAVGSDSSNDNNFVDSTAIEINRQTIITCVSFEDYEAKAEKINNLIRRVFKNETRTIKIDISYIWED